MLDYSPGHHQPEWRRRSEVRHEWESHDRFSKLIWPYSRQKLYIAKTVFKLFRLIGAAGIPAYPLTLIMKVDALRLLPDNLWMLYLLRCKIAKIVYHNLIHVDANIRTAESKIWLQSSVEVCLYMHLPFRIKRGIKQCKDSAFCERREQAMLRCCIGKFSAFAIGIVRQIGLNYTLILENLHRIVNLISIIGCGLYIEETNGAV